MTVAFIVSATGGKVTELIVIWKSKILRCFRYLEDKSRPADLHYFSNEKSWMNTDIMVKILSMLDAEMKSQNRNVILFIDNAPCHPPDLKNKFSNINVCFLPKNTTSRLQPLDARIIQNFKEKYRKLLLKFVISRVNDKKTASEIVKEVDALKAMVPFCREPIDLSNEEWRSLLRNEVLSTKTDENAEPVEKLFASIVTEKKSVRMLSRRNQRLHHCLKLSR